MTSPVEDSSTCIPDISVPCLNNERKLKSVIHLYSCKLGFYHQNDYVLFFCFLTWSYHFRVINSLLCFKGGGKGKDCLGVEEGTTEQWEHQQQYIIHSKATHRLQIFRVWDLQLWHVKWQRFLGTHLWSPALEGCNGPMTTVWTECSVYIYSPTLTVSSSKAQPTYYLWA